MKFYVKNTDIITNKKIPESRIIAISDLHYTKSLGKGFLDALTNKLQSLAPSYICFLGDLVDDDSKEVLDWLNDLAKIAPVYFVFGNHDISRFIPAKNEYYETYLNNEMINDMKNINGLEVLDNGKTITNNGYSFTGLPYYDIFEVDDFAKKVNSYDINLDYKNYNTMLVHNPWIMNPEEFAKLDPKYNETNLVLSGHTHAGMMPHLIDKHIPGNRGLYAPTQGLLPKTTRGNMEVIEEGLDYDGIIVPALRTMPEMGSIGNVVNKIAYPPAICEVNVLKKK